MMKIEAAEAEMSIVPSVGQAPETLAPKIPNMQCNSVFC